MFFDAEHSFFGHLVETQLPIRRYKSRYFHKLLVAEVSMHARGCDKGTSSVADPSAGMHNVDGHFASL